MKVKDLPPLAKEKLDDWRCKREAYEARKRRLGDVNNPRKFRASVAESIGLLENSRMSLSELAKEYQVDPSSATKCNTKKLQESTAINICLKCLEQLDILDYSLPAV